MKFARIFFAVAFLCLMKNTIVYSQTGTNRKENFSAGQWQISLKDGIGKGNELSRFVNGQEVYKHNILQAQAGCFIVNRLLVGIGFTWSREWSIRQPDQESFTDFMKGPLLRYQFTRTSVSPFLEVSYQFGKRSTGARSVLDYVGYSVRSTLLNGGVNVSLTPHLRLEASYGIQFKTFIDQSIMHHYPQLGVNYAFGGK